MSVPSQWRRFGDCSACAASGASGSYGVSSGARSAIAVNRTSAPSAVNRTSAASATTESVLRRRRRHSAAGGLRRATTALPETDSRVDKPIRQIDGEIDEHVDDGHEEHEALNRAGVL